MERMIYELTKKIDALMTKNKQGSSKQGSSSSDSEDSSRSKARRRRERDKASSDVDCPTPKRRDKPKIEDIPEFHGSTENIGDEFLDWVQCAEKVFDYKEYDEKNAFKIAELKLKSYASLWLENLQKRRRKEDREKIKTWSKLKKYMKKRFVPNDYIDLRYYIHKLEMEKMLRDREKKKEREIAKNMVEKVELQDVQELQKSHNMNVREEEEFYEEEKIQNQEEKPCEEEKIQNQEEERRHEEELYEEEKIQNQEDEHVSEVEVETYESMCVEESQKENSYLTQWKVMENSQGMLLIEDKEMETRFASIETNFDMVIKEVEDRPKEPTHPSLSSIMGEIKIVFLRPLQRGLLQIHGDEQPIDFIAVSQKEWDDPNVKARINAMPNFYHTKIEEAEDDDYKIEFSEIFGFGATFNTDEEGLLNLRTNSFEEEEDELNIDMKKRKINKRGIG